MKPYKMIIHFAPFAKGRLNKLLTFSKAGDRTRGVLVVRVLTHEAKRWRYFTNRLWSLQLNNKFFKISSYEELGWRSGDHSHLPCTSTTWDRLPDPTRGLRFVDLNLTPRVTSGFLPLLARKYRQPTSIAMDGEFSIFLFFLVRDNVFYPFLTFAGFAW